MKIDSAVVNKVAHLARIELKQQELQMLSGQLQGIINFIDKLKELDVADIQPASHILPVSNVFRGDSPVPSLPNQKALANAPAPQGNFFGVPKVIE